MESMITWAKTYFCTTVDKWYMYIIISVRRGRDTALKKNRQIAGVRVFFFFLDSGFFYVASHSSLGFCISESFS